MSDAGTDPPTDHKRKLLGCCASIAFVLGIMGILAYGWHRAALFNLAQTENDRQQLRQRLFVEAKNGRSDVWVLDGELLSMLAKDPECAACVTYLWFSMLDLSDPRFQQAGNFKRLRTVAFYECSNTDNVLRSIRGMPTIENVSFEVSSITDEGIQLLATLPNLKKVHFEQIMPPEKIKLLRQRLPGVERAYWSRSGNQEQWTHEKPSAKDESGSTQAAGDSQTTPRDTP